MGISPLNMMFNPFKGGLSHARFQGKMHCPFCSKHVDPTTSSIGFESDKSRIVLKENLGPFIRVYKCMHCGGEWRYDICKRQLHPYSSFKRGLKLPNMRYIGRVPIINK